MKNSLFFLSLFFILPSCINNSSTNISGKEVIINSRSIESIEDSLLNYNNYPRKITKIETIDSIAREVTIEDKSQRLFINGILVKEKKHGWWLFKKGDFKFEKEYFILRFEDKEKVNQAKYYTPTGLDKEKSFYYSVNLEEKRQDSILYNLNYHTLTNPYENDSILYGFRFLRNNNLITVKGILKDENLVTFPITISKADLPFILEGEIFDLPRIKNNLLIRKIYVLDTLR